MEVSQIKVEKGIPMPPRRLPGELRTLISKMGIGDSFVVDEGSERDRILTDVNRYKEGPKVASRKIPERGYRIWRIK